MIKSKQKNIKVLEITIDSKDEFFSYIDKNYLLIRSYLFELNGNFDSEVREFLDAKNISYVGSDTFKSEQVFKKKVSILPQIEDKKDEEESIITPQPTSKLSRMIITDTLRSGQEISEDVDLTIFGRVNSGSKVLGTKNIEVFNEIDGTVICEGDYLILKSIGKGKVIFRGVLLDNEQFNGTYKVVYFDNEVKIKEL